MTVTQVNRNEADVDLFAVPPGYKVVDMTPPEAESPFLFGSCPRRSNYLGGGVTTIIRIRTPALDFGSNRP